TRRSRRKLRAPRARFARQEISPRSLMIGRAPRPRLRVLGFLGGLGVTHWISTPPQRPPDSARWAKRGTNRDGALRLHWHRQAKLAGAQDGDARGALRL